MHQDQRIGLALGVLLVGACAAFFFRNEARTVTPVPRLQHAQELDDRIAERSTRPYLKGIEAVEAADRRRERALQDQESSDGDHSTNQWSPLDPPGARAFGDSSARNRKSLAKPADESDIQELAPIAIPSDHLASDNSGVNHSESNARRSNSKPAVSDAKVHIVQKGETLSSIAAKTLGSPNRFLEIFQANEDQLIDPNDLKLGMALRIPDSRQAIVPKAHSDNLSPTFEHGAVATEQTHDSLNDAAPPAFEIRSPEARAEDRGPSSIMLPPALPTDSPIDAPGESWPTDDSSTSPSKKFVPSRRGAPPARPIGPQAKSTPSRETGVRRLSQASLESTSGKVAR